MNKSLSVVISAFNEEANLARCLSSVSFADEIIVIDNQSTDSTAKIAKSFKAKVYSKSNNLMLNINKNYGFSKASSEWILNLDADEEIPVELAEEIKAITQISQESVQGYWISRKNIIFGKWIQHGLWWPDKQLRLFKRGKGKFRCENIHEYISVDGPSAALSFPYNHYNYTSISLYIRTIDRCTTSEAQVLRETGYRLMWYDALRFPLSDFMKIYFAEGGYRDGLHGLMLAILQSFYSFITFAKAWEDHGFVQEDVNLVSVNHELTRNIKDIRYWMRQSEIALISNPAKKLLKKLTGKAVGSIGL